MLMKIAVLAVTRILHWIGAMLRNVAIFKGKKCRSHDSIVLHHLLGAMLRKLKSRSHGSIVFASPLGAMLRKLVILCDFM